MAKSFVHPMRVYTYIEVDRNEMPILVELSDMQLAAKRCLFAYIHRVLTTPPFADELGAALARGLPDTGCLLLRGGELAIISAWVPADYKAANGFEFTNAVPIGSVKPETFSCSWDPVTTGLVYNASDN